MPKNVKRLLIILAAAGAIAAQVVFWFVLFQQARLPDATESVTPPPATYNNGTREVPVNPDLLIPCKREGNVFTNVDGTKYILGSPVVGFDREQVSTEEAYRRIKLGVAYEIGMFQHPVKPHEQPKKVVFLVLSTDQSASKAQCPPHLLPK